MTRFAGVLPWQNSTKRLPSAYGPLSGGLSGC